MAIQLRPVVYLSIFPEHSILCSCRQDGSLVLKLSIYISQDRLIVVTSSANFLWLSTTKIYFSPSLQVSADLVKGFDAGSLPWIIQVGPACNHEYFYKRQAEEDLTA